MERKKIYWRDVSSAFDYNNNRFLDASFTLFLSRSFSLSCSPPISLYVWHYNRHAHSQNHHIIHHYYVVANVQHMHGILPPLFIIYNKQNTTNNRKKKKTHAAKAVAHTPSVRVYRKWCDDWCYVLCFAIALTSFTSFTISIVLCASSSLRVGMRFRFDLYIVAVPSYQNRLALISILIEYR